MVIANIFQNIKSLILIDPVSAFLITMLMVSLIALFTILFILAQKAW